MAGLIHRVSLGLTLLAAPVSAAAAGQRSVPELSDREVGSRAPVVARLEVELPSTGPFLLRGTVPVPAGTWVAGGGAPLALRDPGTDTWLATQLEVVSRYPDAANDGPDVVELLARVTPDASWAVGERRRFDVVRIDGPPAPDPGAPDPTDLAVGPSAVPLSVQALVLDPDALVVVATDPLGNLFVAKPLRGSGGMRLARYGCATATLRTHEFMEPVVPPPPLSYPHLFGVQSYLHTRGSEEVLRLDLRIHNGPDRRDIFDPQDDKLGKVWFERIDLYVRSDLAPGWSVDQQFADPFAFDPATDTPGAANLGGIDYAVFPIVEPLPAAGVQPMHMMPCKAQFLRRLAIRPASASAAARDWLDERGLGFAVAGTAGERELWSWWNPETARYFPQRQLLGPLDFTNATYGGLADLRSELTAWYTGLRNALALDQPIPFPDDGAPLALGWARPLGSPASGQTGGTGIQFVDGERTLAAASLDGFRYQRLRHRMHTERMPNALRGISGEATNQTDWLEACPGCDPAIFPPGPGGVPSFNDVNDGFDVDSGSNNPFFCSFTATWLQTAYVQVNGLEPAYETDPDPTRNLEAYLPHDSAHLVRYAKHALALAWIANDAPAKDDVLVQADLFRLTYTDYPLENGTFTGPSLGADRADVDARPNWGLLAGRREGWGVTVAAAANALADDAWRSRLRPWFDGVVELFDDGSTSGTDPNYVDPATALPYVWGYLGSQKGATFYGSAPNDPRGRRVWQDMILQNALRSLARSVYAASDPQRATLEDVLRRTYYGLLAPVTWNEFQLFIPDTGPVSPAQYTPARHNFYDCDPFAFPGNLCVGQTPLPGPPYSPFGTDIQYFHAPLAHGYEATGNALFLERAYEALTHVPCPADPVSALRNELEAIGDPTDPGEYSLWSNRAVLHALVRALAP